MRAIAALFLAAHALAYFWPGGGLWGFDALAGRGPVPLAIFAALSVVVLLPALAARVSGWLESRPGAGAAGAAGAAGVVVIGALLLGAGLAASAAFPTATHLLGDGQLHLGDLVRAARAGLGWGDVAWANDNAPLSFSLLHHAQAWRGGAEAEPQGTFAVLQWLSLALLVPATLWLAREVAATPTERASLVALTLGAGAFQLFCGYAEIYAFLGPVVVAALAATAHAVRRGRGPWLAAGLLGLGVALHFSAISFVPAVMIAAATSARRGGSAFTPAALGRAGLAGAVAVGVAVAVLAAIGFDFANRAGGAGATNLLPWFAAPTHRQAYFAWSPAHVLDVLNLLALVAPALLLTLPAWFARRADAGPARPNTPDSPSTGWMFAAVLFPLLFAFVVNPEVGMFRDWDALAFVAWPAPLLALLAVRRLPLAARGPAALVVAGATLLHTFAWVSLNADGPAAVARFERLLDSTPLSRHGASYGWESLGAYRRSRQDLAGAAEAFDRSAFRAGDNPRLFVAAADMYLQQRNGDLALDRLTRAFRLNTEDPRALMALEQLAGQADPSLHGEVRARIQELTERARRLQREPR